MAARCLCSRCIYVPHVEDTPSGQKIILGWSTLYINQIKIYYEISSIYEYVDKKSMIICCDMWMICLELNWFFCDPCRIFQLSEFMDVTFFGMSRLNNFLLIDTTDRSKNSSDHLRIFFETHPLFCHQHFFNMKDSVVFLGLKLLILIKLSVFKLIYNPYIQRN